jgi:hypothetical protein
MQLSGEVSAHRAPGPDFKLQYPSRCFMFLRADFYHLKMSSFIEE